ncbi:MAG TPA: glycoside hydrolase family 16 protein, partial [Acidimicrobiales bacterium]|nr:glycoside hydrolase family 16 protein [Acidimicrobiales bacterium]
VGLASLGPPQRAAGVTDRGPSLPAGVTGRWKLAFDDEFTGPHPGLGYWKTCYDWACTNAGNDELEWYKSQNVTVSGGALRLTARTGAAHGKPYTSGMIQSNHRFVFRYGFVETRARVPAGTGFWSAFWLLPADGAWPPEIDVMEVYGLHPSVAALTVHYGDNQAVQKRYRGPDYSRRYHVFGVDWEPGSITWYVDGVLAQRVAISLSTPMYLLATLAIAGSNPPTAATVFPAAMSIKWIRVFQHPNDSQALP